TIGATLPKILGEEPHDVEGVRAIAVLISVNGDNARLINKPALFQCALDFFEAAVLRVALGPQPAFLVDDDGARRMLIVVSEAICSLPSSRVRLCSLERLANFS